MRKQTQKKHEQAADQIQGRKLKCDVCGIVLHQYIVSVGGKKIIGIVIEQDTIARGIKFTVCRGCKGIIEEISTGGRCEAESDDVETMLRYLNAKLNRVTEALYSVSVSLGEEG